MPLDIYKNKGFTLVELLVVIGISAVIATITIPVYGNWQSTIQLDNTVEQTTQIIRSAKTNSQSGLNNSAYGVYFEVNSDGGGKLISYQGDSYNERNQEYDKIADLDNSILLTEDFANNEINFSKGSGIPSGTGTINIRQGLTDNRIIIINSLGIIE